jgi:hypothetical protein
LIVKELLKNRKIAFRCPTWVIMQSRLIIVEIGSMSRLYFRPFLLVALVIAPSGCGSAEKKGWTSTVLVKGKVSYKGQPVADAQVTFHPIDKGGGATVPGAFGRTDAQGRFVLRTFGDSDGAAAGEFVVLVTKEVEESPAAPADKIDIPRSLPKFKSHLPTFLGKPATSPLRVTIPASGSHSFEVVLGEQPTDCSISPGK